MKHLYQCFDLLSFQWEIRIVKFVKITIFFNLLFPFWLVLKGFLPLFNSTSGPFVVRRILILTWQDRIPSDIWSIQERTCRCRCQPSCPSPSLYSTWVVFTNYVVLSFSERLKDHLRMDILFCLITLTEKVTWLLLGVFGWDRNLNR